MSQKNFLGHNVDSQAARIDSLILFGGRDIRGIADELHIGKAGGEYPQAQRKNSGRGGHGQEAHKALIGRVKCHLRHLAKRFGSIVIEAADGSLSFNQATMQAAEKAGEYRAS